MSTNIRVNRICQYCGTGFIAKTTVTRYCSHQCNSKAYKAKVRNAKVMASNNETQTISVAATETLNAKEFLSILDACKLIGVSRMTLHRQIKSGRLKVKNIGRRIIIRKNDLESFLK